MTRNKLSAVRVRKTDSGKLYDGGGLMIVRQGDGGKWLYRYTHLGRRREMGLGTWPVVGLADARAARDRWAAELAAGRDPIAVRDARREAERAELSREDPTLEELAKMVLRARSATLRGGGLRGRWMSPLTLHVLPKIGRRRVSTIRQVDIRDALEPIWRTKHPTAAKAIQRLRIILREGELMGFPCAPVAVDAAQRMPGEVLHVPAPTPATPWQDMPALWAKLEAEGGASARCLQWAMLTVVRLDGCRGARLDEIDGDVWTVPADRVKGREGRVADFRVPLAPAALEIVARAREISDDLLFEGQRRGRPITDRALEKTLDRLRETGRPHGFRTSFRTWVQDRDVCSYDVAETCLGHIVGSRVERSYARSDLLDRRRTVMEAWARFLTGQEAAQPLRFAAS